METLLRDLRHAARSLRRSPGFSTVAVLTRIHGLTEGAPPIIYLPLGKVPSRNGSYSLLVSSTGAPAVLATGLREIVRDLDPALPIYGVEPLRHTLRTSLGQQRFTMMVLGLFAAVALLLGAVGVYGVVSHAVSSRTREIGIRTALGAEPRDVRRLILGEGVALAVVGVGLGVLGALALSRVLASLVHGVSASDPWVLAGVSLLLAGVAVVASYLPARRATRVDPIAALRAE